mmetsp:Transcript_27788/g.94840  ORF Transcript_27788/g.94840 Transcript_27788/m.94840 type:complete len:179 (+) Transcript_27788:3-539(+)
MAAKAQARGVACSRRTAGRAGRRAAKLATRAVSEPSATNTVLTDDSSRKFSFIVANANFMLNDENSEHFPELLRERRRHYLETDEPINFWVVEQPAFVDSLGEVSGRIGRPCVAVVSTDDVFITFLKLRMDRVLKGELEGKPSEVLKSDGEIEPFPQPASWTAPYAKYGHGWWHVFRP